MRLTQLNNIKPATASHVAFVYFALFFITIPLTALFFVFISVPIYLLYKLPIDISKNINNYFLKQ